MPTQLDPQIVAGWISQHWGARWGLAGGAAIAVLGAGAVALWLKSPALLPAPPLTPVTAGPVSG